MNGLTSIVGQHVKGLVGSRPFAIINPMEFGAKNDGSEDASGAIQAAIDVAHRQAKGNGLGGGLVYLPHGQYKISNTINLKGYVVLCGAGLESTCLKQDPDSDLDAVVEYVHDTGQVYFAGLRDLQIKGLGADATGKEKTNYGFRCIQTDTGLANDFHMTRVFIVGCLGSGAAFGYGWGVHISHCLFEFNGGHGIMLFGSQNYISNCFSAYNEAHGFRLAGQHTLAQGLHAYQNGYAGVSIAGENIILMGSSIRNNNTRSAGQPELETTGSGSGAIIIGNRIERVSTQDGAEISASGGTDHIIIGNRLIKGDMRFGATNFSTCRVADNHGYTTENGGTAEVANGGTIAHGLKRTPTIYSVTPTVPNRIVAVTAVDATHMTISLQDLTGAVVEVAENVVWRAKA